MELEKLNRIFGEREREREWDATKVHAHYTTIGDQMTGIWRAMTGGKIERTGMGMEERERAAREWLEGIIATSQSQDAAGEAVWKGGFFDALSLSGLRVSRAQAGRALCFFRVPAHLTDGEGNWQAGAIGTVMDDVGAAAIMTTEGLIKISVQFDISYFSPVRANEEVEIDARVVEHRGGRRLTAVVVEIRKKGNGQMVAVGRQWMTAGRPLHSNL